MKTISAIFLLFYCLASTSQNLEIYVSAHPDDWQLFMNPNAYNSVANKDNKVLFLHTTAGDAGHGMGNNGYALAREEGSLRAIRFMCNSLREEPGLGQKMTNKIAKVRGHQIQKNTYANTVAYFLRLSDGNYYGPGYEATGLESLRRIRGGAIKSISSVDGSTTYKTLEDLKATLLRLLKSEAKGYETIVLNIAETDTIANTGDHSDHLNSSWLMQDVASDLNVSLIRYYEEYSTNKKPINVEGADFLNCAGTWGATASGLSDMGHYSTWDSTHNSWIGRQYYREEKLGK